MKMEDGENLSGNLDKIQSKIDLNLAKEKQVEIAEEIEKLEEIHKNQKAQMKKTLENELKNQLDEENLAEFIKELEESTEKIELEHQRSLDDALSAFDALKNAELEAEIAAMKKLDKSEDEIENFIEDEKSSRLLEKGS